VGHHGAGTLKCERTRHLHAGRALRVVAVREHPALHPVLCRHVSGVGRRLAAGRVDGVLRADRAADRRDALRDGACRLLERVRRIRECGRDENLAVPEFQIDPPTNLPQTVPRLIWHHRLRALIVPTIAHPSPNDGFFYYNPLTEGWGWQHLANVTIGRDHALVHVGTGVGTPTWTHFVVDTNGNILGEQPPPSARPGIYVDTKDFALPADRYIDAIKLDWEPLFPSTVLRVSCLAREGINDGLQQGVIYGTLGYE